MNRLERAEQIAEANSPNSEDDVLRPGELLETPDRPSQGVAENVAKLVIRVKVPKDSSWLENFSAVSDAPDHFEGELLAESRHGGVTFEPFLNRLNQSHLSIKQAVRYCQSETGNAYVYVTLANGSTDVSEHIHRAVLALLYQDFGGGDLVQRNGHSAALHLSQPGNASHDPPYSVRIRGNKVVMSGG